MTTIRLWACLQPYMPRKPLGQTAVNTSENFSILINFFCTLARLAGSGMHNTGNGSTQARCDSEWERDRGRATGTERLGQRQMAFTIFANKSRLSSASSSQLHVICFYVCPNTWDNATNRTHYFACTQLRLTLATSQAEIQDSDGRTTGRGQESWAGANKWLRPWPWIPYIISAQCCHVRDVAFLFVPIALLLYFVGSEVK